MMDSFTRALVWFMLPFVACGFAMGIASVRRIKRLQERIDKLEGK